MNYPSLSFKNQKLLRQLIKYGDKRLDFKNKDFPKYMESDIYELIKCGYFKCELPCGHARSFDNNWNFVGTITYEGRTYYRGRLKEHLRMLKNLICKVLH